MFVWPCFADRLVKLSNDQGVYLGLVLVATDGIVIIEQLYWGNQCKPKTGYWIL